MSTGDVVLVVSIAFYFLYSGWKIWGRRQREVEWMKGVEADALKYIAERERDFDR